MIENLTPSHARILAVLLLLSGLSLVPSMSACALPPTRKRIYTSVTASVRLKGLLSRFIFSFSMDL